MSSTLTATNTPSYKQPKGLFLLFSAELWERFGFYCIQSLLVLYLSQVYLFSDTKSYMLFSAFSALIYATPVIGGYIADKILGFQHSILLGGFLYLFGYLLLAIPHNPYFYLALSLIIWGNGFFKSSVSSLVGLLYEENDPRRDSGFTLFYMGINIGSFISPIVCTAIAVKYGWNYGFGTAGIGMMIGIASCLYGFKQLGEKGLAPKTAKKQWFGVKREFIIYLGVLIGIVGINFLLHFDNVVNGFLIAFSIVTIVFLFYLTFRYKEVERKKLFALIVLIVFSIIFWAFYMQTFLSITLFIDRIVNRHIIEWTVPTAMFQSINPFFIIVLSPILARFWLTMNKWKINISTSAKFALGLLLIGFGFLSLALGVYLSGGLVSVNWLVLAFFLQTLGELALSPIGLSAVTRLAPPDLRGMMMGVWFLSLAAAFALAGRLATLTSIPPNVNNFDMISKLYGVNFFHFGLIGVLFAVILFMLTPKLKAMMQE